jgi:hypothetical protein
MLSCGISVDTLLLLLQKIVSDGISDELLKW